jgi:hypothetical protein
MRRQAIGLRGILLGAAVGVMVLGLWSTQAAVAQNNNNNNNGDYTPDNAVAITPLSGVAVDAQGVLRRQSFADPNGLLARQRIAAAKAALTPDLLRFNAMRKISLTRLEKAIQKNQGVLTDEMRYLAGLLRVRYVFYYPDSKDIVLAGPAEGWVHDPSERVVGVTSGRPVLQLQDLIVALRAFPPDQEGAGLISCSIDPTQEGLTNLQQFLRGFGSRAVPAQTETLVVNLKNSLGPQTITIGGVSPKTHFAQVLVEADYRMKLIGIGLEQPPVRMVSFVEKVNPGAVSRNALFRWYFVPDYQCVRVADDKLAAELVGDGVKLVGEDELVSAQGGRARSGKSSQASQAFCLSFTQKYSQLAERSPVYAQLRNLVDLAVAAAFIQEQGYCQKAGWDLGLFADEKALPVETYNAPKQVESAVAAIWKGNRLMTPIGGGVHLDAATALKSENLLSDEDGKVAKTRSQTKLHLADGQWWWD